MKPELEKEIDTKALALIQQTRMETDGKFYREMVSTIKQYAQDTDRLNWLLSHPGADIDKAVVTGRGIWRVVWYSEGAHYIAWGADMRGCIDSAIAGKTERL